MHQFRFSTLDRADSYARWNTLPIQGSHKNDKNLKIYIYAFKSISFTFQVFLPSLFLWFMPSEEGYNYIKHYEALFIKPENDPWPYCSAPECLLESTVLSTLAIKSRLKWLWLQQKSGWGRDIITTLALSYAPEKPVSFLSTLLLHCEEIYQRKLRWEVVLEIRMRRL